MLGPVIEDVHAIFSTECHSFALSPGCLIEKCSGLKVASELDSVMAVSEKVRLLAQNFAELSDEEQRDFVELVAAADGDEVTEEWKQELHSRIRDIDEGRVQLIDGDEFLRQLRAI